MPSALITGVSGQDGSYLAERLHELDWDVHGLIHQSEPVSAEGVTIHHGDLRDATGMYHLLRELRPAHVYNLAGISSVALSWEQPELTSGVTGHAVAGLLEACWRAQRATGTQTRVLQASSAEIFGDPDETPQNESTRIRPINPYGAAKAYAHHLVGVYRARGLFAVSCILYNHESPRRSVNFVSRKISRAVAQIAMGREERLVLGNLDASRDWTWAPDVVEALVRALSYSDAHDYVVASGEAHTVRDFVAVAFASVGISDWENFVAIDDKLVRPTDAAQLVGDASLARQALGWRPTVSFEEMVQRMVEADIRAQQNS